MKETRTIRHEIDVEGASITVGNAEEGDIVEVVDVESVEVSVDVKSDGKDSVLIETVPDKPSSSDVLDFYIEGDSDVVKQLYDVLRVATKNINEQGESDVISGE